jgi:hypothetical protein
MVFLVRGIGRGEDAAGAKTAAGRLVSLRPIRLLARAELSPERLHGGTGL